MVSRASGERRSEARTQCATHAAEIHVSTSDSQSEAPVRCFLILAGADVHVCSA